MALNLCKREDDSEEKEARNKRNIKRKQCQLYTDRSTCTNANAQLVGYRNDLLLSIFYYTECTVMNCI